MACISVRVERPDRLVAEADVIEEHIAVPFLFDGLVLVFIHLIDPADCLVESLTTLLAQSCNGSHGVTVLTCSLQLQSAQRSI